MSTGDKTAVVLGADADPGFDQSVTVEDLLTLPSAGGVTLTCAGDNGVARDAKVMAIQVGALHG